MNAPRCLRNIVDLESREYSGLVRVRWEWNGGHVYEATVSIPIDLEIEIDNWRPHLGTATIEIEPRPSGKTAPRDRWGFSVLDRVDIEVTDVVTGKRIATIPLGAMIEVPVKADNDLTITAKWRRL